MLSVRMVCNIYTVILCLLLFAVDLISALQGRYLMHALLKVDENKKRLVHSAISVVLDKHERLFSFDRDALHYTLACSAYNVGELLSASLEKYNIDAYPHFMSPTKNMACYSMFLTDKKKMELRSEGMKFLKFPYELIKVPGPTKLGHVHLPSVALDQSDNAPLEVTLNLHGHNARDVLQSVLAQSLKMLRGSQDISSKSIHGHDMRILQAVKPSFVALSTLMETHLGHPKAKESCHDILSMAIKSRTRYGSLYEDPQHETFSLKNIGEIENNDIVACGAMLSIIASMDTSISSVHFTTNDNGDVYDNDIDLSSSATPIEEIGGDMTHQIQLVQSQLDVPYNSTYTVGRPYTNIGLMGQGYTVGIFDTAIDDYSCFFRDESGTHTPHTYDKDFFQLNPTVEMDRRKVVGYMVPLQSVPVPGSDYWPDKVNGTAHGQWVSGQVVGACNDPSTDGKYDGIANRSKIIFMDQMAFTDDAGHSFYPNGWEYFLTFFNISRSIGAEVHSLSWGSYGTTAYFSSAVKMDEEIYTYPNTAAFGGVGNNGVYGPKSTILLGVCKNCITVGASIDTTTMAPFSSVGPNYDGRLAPHITSPGWKILSSATYSMKCKNEDPQECNNTVYQSCNMYSSSGTSMATPLTAGVGILIKQYFRDIEYWSTYCSTFTYKYSSCIHGTGVNISGYLLRGLLIASATPMLYYECNPAELPPGKPPCLSGTSVFLGGNDPNMYAGYGFTSMKNVLPIPGLYDFDLYIQDNATLSSFHTRSYPLYIPGPVQRSREIVASISWYDPPNKFWANKALINDLDLSITTPSGDILYGNGIPGDDLNPVERVVIPAIDVKEGRYIVKVTSKLISVSSSQAYGIVITSAGHVVENEIYEQQIDPDDIVVSPQKAACERTGTSSYLRFHVWDLQQGLSWQNVTMTFTNTKNVVVNTCKYNYDSKMDTDLGQLEQSCWLCLDNNDAYSVELQNSSPEYPISSDIRAIFQPYSTSRTVVSKFQTMDMLTISDTGEINVCNDLMIDLTMSTTSFLSLYYTQGWRGLAYFSVTDINSGDILHADTLIAADADSVLLCVPDGSYKIQIYNNMSYYSDDDYIEYVNSYLDDLPNVPDVDIQSYYEASISSTLCGFPTGINATSTIHVDTSTGTCALFTTGSASDGGSSPSTVLIVMLSVVIPIIFVLGLAGWYWKRKQRSKALMKPSEFTLSNM